MVTCSIYSCYFCLRFRKASVFSCFGFCEICSDYWRLINDTSPLSSLLELERESERKRERRVMREKEKVIRESRERQKESHGRHD